MGAFCGAIQRAWDSSGHEPGRITVGFAFVPARDDSQPAVGTVVPHEGGPGYSTTGSAGTYAQMYGPLLARRNLLLVDQRGTGRSEPIDCPDLQDLKGKYAPAAGRCGRSLGIRSDNYSSAESADDLAAVIRALDIPRVDLYGDSYGTFFAQVFAGRHPGLLRSVVLDSAYPTYGETAWYPTQTPAMQRAFTLACARSRPCATAGSTPMQLLRSVLARVRVHPYRGMSHDADGRPVQVVVNGENLVSVAFGATYGAAFYREFAASLRSALHGDPVPLLRITAEAIGGGTDAGPVRGYSEGLDAAVSCHDYPQLYDMTASPAVRREQLAASVRRENLRNPGLFAPFTIKEYLASSWEEQDWCTQWPVAAESNPAGPPKPPSGHYAATPVLVLSGELDSITTAAEGALVVGQFPDARQVVVANSFHVTAAGDTDQCAVNVLRFFVRSPLAAFPRQVLACTRAVPPIRTLGTFARTLAQVVPARNLGDSRATLTPAPGGGRLRPPYRRRPAGPVAEQLQRPRGRAPRGDVELHRRPGDHLPAHEGTAHERPRREWHGDLGTLRQHDAGRPHPRVPARDRPPGGLLGHSHQRRHSSPVGHPRRNQGPARDGRPLSRQLPAEASVWLSLQSAVSSERIRAQSAFRRILDTSGRSNIGAKTSDDTTNVLRPSEPATTVADRAAPSIIEISPK